MPKVVLNRCYGGFSLSEQAYNELGLPWDGCGFAYEIKRDDPKLVEVVERLGSKANGECAKLEVIEVPDGIEWHISEYDGKERVREDHRSW